MLQMTKSETASLGIGRKRPVLVIVPEWPGGTRAQKFGYAMTSALRVKQKERTLVQFAPERIFRAETDVREAEFREKLASYDLCHVTVHFVAIE